MPASPNSNAAHQGADPLVLAVFRLGKPPEQTRREAGYIVDLLGLTAPAHLLDVPCGGGRLAVEMAARGHRVTGVDSAAALLDDARVAAAARGLETRISIEQRDMRDLPWHEAFDGAYCFWESFGFFDDAGNCAFLSAIAAALKPGGRFVFDTHVAETMLPRLGQRPWEHVDDDLLVLEERDYDPATAVMTRHLTIVGHGRTATLDVSTRLYTYRELLALLRSSGFAACEGYSWLSIVPFMMGAPRLLMVATRG
ncbi:MAG: class I SAM-dependent methyltransferase [Anaerolineae bacterium]|nr:class I SAM-dependent methyltransferase [Anaerolineae bacterium]